MIKNTKEVNFIDWIQRGIEKYIGEIDLMVYTEGVNFYTTFMIISSCSAYNAILERPWLHDMKVVPSTYHQALKFPIE